MADVAPNSTRRRWRYQFSLRQLLILMAVVAVVTALWTAEQRKKEVRSWPRRFHQALQSGDLEEVNRLIKIEPRLAHEQEFGYFSSSHTPLQRALISGNPEVLARILQERPDINRRSLNGETILHTAVSHQMISATGEFLKLGADPNALDTSGQSALGMALWRDRVGQMIQVLLDGGADPNLPWAGREGKTPLHTAAEIGNDAAAGRLVAAGANVSARDVKGRTPLHLALRRHDLKMAQLMLANGADLTARDHDGLIPGVENNGTNTATAALVWWEQIVKAHDLGHVAKLEAMLAAAPEAIAFRSGELETTHLHRAVGNRRFDIVEFLLYRGFDVNARGNEGVRPLHLATSPSHPLELIDRLLDAGADINAKSDYGQTPLHFAARADSPAAIRRLVERGADLGAVDEAGATALDVPFDREYHDDAKRVQALLMEMGHPQTMLYAAETGNIDLMKRLANGDAKPLDRGYTRIGIRPLHAAVLGQNIPSVKWLLDQGVDRNPHRPPGHSFSGLETPLMMAISRQAIDVAVFLIEQGADVNLRGRSQLYPIHAAIAWDREPALLESLLAHGADRSLLHEGKTADELGAAARPKYRDRYLELLQSNQQSR